MGSRNTLFGFAAAVTAVILVGIFIGYEFSGARSAPAPAHPPAPSAAVPADLPAPTPIAAPPQAPPLQNNANYTAPNAPRIQITEEKNPSLTNTTPLVQKPRPSDSTDIPTPDVEAAQGTASPQSADNSTGVVSNSGDSNTPPAPPAEAGGNTAPVSLPPPAPSPAGDADFEHITPSSGGKALYRVQIGAFAAARNARILSEALNRRGYSTSTRTEHDGDKIVYKVQAGAYRSRAAAGKAAQDLQGAGYPASVAPITP